MAKGIDEDAFYNCTSLESDGKNNKTWLEEFDFYMKNFVDFTKFFTFMQIQDFYFEYNYEDLSKLFMEDNDKEIVNNNDSIVFTKNIIHSYIQVFDIRNDYKSDIRDKGDLFPLYFDGIPTFKVFVMNASKVFFALEYIIKETNLNKKLNFIIENIDFGSIISFVKLIVSFNTNVFTYDLVLFILNFIIIELLYNEIFNFLLQFPHSDVKEIIDHFKLADNEYVRQLLNTLSKIVKEVKYEIAKDYKIEYFYERFMNEIILFCLGSDNENDIKLFILVKSFFLYLNGYHFSSLHYLSKLYLFDKIKYKECYKLGDLIFEDFKKYFYEYFKFFENEVPSLDEITYKYLIIFNDFEKITLKGKKPHAPEIFKEFVQLFSNSSISDKVTVSSIHKEERITGNINNKELTKDISLNNIKSNKPEVKKAISKINENKIKKKFLILSIDGGGIKGLIPLHLLKCIEEETEKPIYEIFDMFSGTSIGGLFALVFSQKKLTAVELYDKFLKEYRFKIFKPSIIPGRRYINWILNMTMHNPEGLEKILNELFGGLTLENSLNNFLITSNIHKNNSISPCVFNKYKKDDKSINNLFLINENNDITFQSLDEFNDTRLCYIGRATSAASPYFPPIVIKNRKFIDGGFSYNNPSELALKFAINECNIDVQDMFMFSLGCSHDNYTENEELELNNHLMYSFIGHTSIKDILRNILGIIWNKNISLNQMLPKNLRNEVKKIMCQKNFEAHNNLIEVLGNRYMRICPNEFEDIEIDDISDISINLLIKKADEIIKEVSMNDLFKFFEVVKLGIEETELGIKETELAKEEIKSTSLIEVNNITHFFLLVISLNFIGPILYRVIINNE